MDRGDKGIKIYSDCSLENLLAGYVANRRSAIRRYRSEDVMVPECVSVSNRGMGQWLRQQLMTAGSVVANMEFPFVRNVIEETIIGHEGHRELFADQVMVWRIYHALNDDSFISRPEMGPLRNYLDHVKGASGRYFLSQQLMVMFYEYMAYIPAELEDRGGAGKITFRGGAKEITFNNEQRWQLLLWKRLCLSKTGELLTSPVSRMLDFLYGRTEAAGMHPAVPLTFFGVSAMPPFYLALLKRLSQSRPVNLYYLSPSREFWLRESTNDVTYVEDEDLFVNPLLDSWGVAGYHFYNAILDEDTKSGLDTGENWDSRSAGVRASEHHGLLFEIQERIHSCSNELSDPRNAVPDDDSLTIHNCYNPMREVEALHDCLLKLLNDDPTLTLNDIVVMVTDMGKFSPCIRAVFDRGVLRGRYGIVERQKKDSNQVAEGMLALMRLPCTRLEQSVVRRLLLLKPLQRHFDLTDEDTARIFSWIDNLKICYGTAEDRGCFCWRSALDRLLLLAAQREEEPERPVPMFDGLVPPDIADSAENLRTIGTLCRLYEQLNDCLVQMVQDENESRKTMPEWQRFLHKMLKDFFSSGAGEDREFYTVSQCIDSLAEHFQTAYEQENIPVDFATIRSAMEFSLAAEPGGGGLFKGRLTFCNMSMMQGIPFRVIAILGLDGDVFPSQDRKPNFNQLRMYADNFPKYATNRASLDRYAFLDALLSAREKLLLFYCGKDDCKGQTLPMAVPLNELNDYALKCWDELWKECGRIPPSFVVMHRLQSGDVKNFNHVPKAPSLTAPFSFDSCALAIGRSRQRIGRRLTERPPAEFLTPFASEILEAPAQLPEALSSEEKQLRISIWELMSFLKAPQESFMTARFGTPRKEWEQTACGDYEPFSMTEFNQRHLRRHAIAPLWNHLPAQKWTPIWEQLEDYDAALNGRCKALRTSGQLSDGGRAETLIGDNLWMSYFANEKFEQEMRQCSPQDVLVTLPQLSLDIKESDDWDPRYRKALAGQSICATVEVTGRVNVLPAEQGNGLRECLDCADKLVPWQMLHFYLSHILWQSANNTMIESQWMATPQDQEPRSFTRSQEVARTTLEQIVRLYLLNKIYPLPLFSSGGLNWTAPDKITAKNIKTDSATDRLFDIEAMDENWQRMLFGLVEDVYGCWKKEGN